MLLLRRLILMTVLLITSSPSLTFQEYSKLILLIQEWPQPQPESRHSQL